MVVEEMRDVEYSLGRPLYVAVAAPTQTERPSDVIGNHV